MYHKVTPDPHSGGLGLRVSPASFAAQMRYLRDHGYTVISMNEVPDFLRGKKSLPPKPVVITFDDGYRDNYRYALPVLKAFGYTATVYLVAHAVGGYNFFDANRGVQPRNEMLTWEEIREMQAAGITFGAHTLDHPSLISLSPEEALSQIRGAKEFLEEKLGCPVVHFSYPYGDFNSEVAAIVAAAGYKTAVTDTPGVNYRGANPFTLKRIRVTGKHALWRFAYELERHGKETAGDLQERRKVAKRKGNF